MFSQENRLDSFSSIMTAPKVLLQWTLTPTFIGGNLESSVLLKNTTTDYKGVGIKPLTLP